jgi:hypothetical protein
MATRPIPGALIRCVCLLALLGLTASCGLYNASHRPAKPLPVSVGAKPESRAQYDLHFIDTADYRISDDPRGYPRPAIHPRLASLGRLLRR